MLEEASQEISRYLTLGIHHSTSDAQKSINQIIKKHLAAEFQKHTPTGFSVKLQKLVWETTAEDYSI